MPLRPCIDCKRLHRNASRCDACTTLRSQQRGSSTARGYGSGWRAVRKQVLDAHLAAHGQWCPGWQVVGHYSTDLTVDHVIPKSRGGSDEPGNLSVLCRGCNGRKRDRISMQR